MENFIDKVVQDLLKKHSDFKDVTVVFPGKRPILFFRKSFVNQQTNTGILPQFLSIEELIQKISKLELLPIVKQWLLAYKVYNKNIKNPEDFNSFISWIPTVLNDFNDLDAALVNENDIFKYLISVERINNWSLDSNQNFHNNTLIKTHLLFWEMLHEFYIAFNKELDHLNCGYNGKLLRTAALNLDEFIKTNKTHFVFVGFNALSSAENKIIETLESKECASTYWQADEYYINDLNHEAGVFLRAHKNKRKAFNWINNSFKNAKNIEVVKCAKQVSQAKYVHEILKTKSELELKETALVLADETLLPSVLNSLPENIKSANITMGLELAQLPIAQFFSLVFDLHLNKSRLGNERNFYFKDVLSIVNNQHFELGECVKSELVKLQQKIQTENKIFLSFNEINDTISENLFLNLFKPFKSSFEFLNNISEFVKELIQNKEQKLLTKEVLFNFYKILNQLKDEIWNNDVIIELRSLRFLYQNLLAKESLNFVGEPLQGLQILGMLETRLLDFNHIILCGVNEGILPNGVSDNSFIPFDIRKQFKLNTYVEKDSIFAYHFYRLIQNATNVHLLFDSNAEGLQNGEESRFIKQLELYFNLKWVNPSMEFVPNSNEINTIEKSDLAIQKLNNWKNNGVSASSLNQYIRNPIEFYAQKVLGVYKDEELDEYIGNLTLGNIVHKTLEELYKPYLNQLLTPKILSSIRKDSTAYVSTLFKNELGSNSYKSGRNLIAFNVVLKMINELLKKDEQIVKNKDSLIITGLEEVFKLSTDSNKHENIMFKGVVDRIDVLNDSYRIIDYKTGSVNETYLKINDEKLNLVFEESNRSIALQLMFYSILFFNQSNINEAIFGVYPLRYTKKKLSPIIYNQSEILQKEDSNTFMPYFFDSIDEILDSNLDFKEPVEP